MSEPAITVDHISKRFRIGATVRAPRTLKEALAAGVSRQAAALRDVVRRGGARPARRTPEFWALRDVTFAVQQGQVLGLIGRNGSGKSTLLKILARITPPTEGEAVIVGRVGSLLEIGTGFHHELTGRENIFLSGTILGMRRPEIAARFDEIVEFSGVEQFIDTPVKRYSSGMFLRLAFAVAAHLRTEILLIDEVLAVGDASFQKKCIEKMSEVAHGGRTVVFVSHNLGAVSRLCDRGVVLDHGRVVAGGPVDEAIQAYGRVLKSSPEPAAPGGGGGIAVLDFGLEQGAEPIGPSTPVTLGFSLAVREPYWAVSVFAGITSAEGTNLVIESVSSERFPELVAVGLHRIEMALPPLWLRPQGYSAWVKVIAHPRAGPTQRFRSDWIEFVVAGDHASDTNADRLLSPATRWDVRPLPPMSGV